MSLRKKLKINILISGVLLLAIVFPMISQAIPIGEGYSAPTTSVVGNFWDMGLHYGAIILNPVSGISSTLHNYGFTWFPDLSVGKSQKEGLAAMREAALISGGGPGELRGKFVDEESARQLTEANQDDSCSPLNVGGCIRAALAAIGDALTWVFGSLLVAAGTILDISIKVSILSVKDWLINSGIDNAWRVLRDIGNLCFVFILLYIAIGTIFELQGIGDPKKLIVNVIIIALLVNFSGFFTRIIIDASNVVAYEFYVKMGGGIATGGNKLGIGGQLVSKLNLSQQFIGGPSVLVKATDADGNEVTILTPVIGSLSIAGIIIQTFGNIIIILVSCFVLIAMSIMFLIRTVYLIFLYVISPIAFVLYVIPNGRHHFDAWLKKLLHQAFVAPGIIVPLYVVFIFLKDGIGGLLGKDANSLGSMGPMILVFMNFMIVGLLFGCILIANSLGAAGAGAARSWGRRLGFGALGIAGGYTVGNLANRLATSQRMQAWASSARPITGRVAMGARRALGSIGNSGFGTGTRGYRTRVEERQRAQQQRAAGFTGPQAGAQRASYMSRLRSTDDRDAYFRSLSPEDKATVVQQLRTQGRGNEANRLLASGSGRAARETSAASWRGIDPGNDAERLAHLNSLDGPQLNNLYEGLNAREKADLEAFVNRMAPPTPGVAGAPPIPSALGANVATARGAFERNARTTATARGEVARERGRVNRTEQATAELNIGTPGRTPLAHPMSSFNPAWAAANPNEINRINALRNLAGPEFVEFATNTDLFNGAYADIYPYLTNEQLRSALTMGVPHTERQAIRTAIEHHRGAGPHPTDRTIENAYQYLNDPRQGGAAF